MAVASQLDERIQRFRRELIGFLARRVPGEAEELAQEVWLKIAKANPDCPDDASFRAYMYTVARRLVIDHHRRRKARIELVPAEQEQLERSPGSSDPESQSRAGQILGVVQDTLRAMKPEIAEVFQLRMSTQQSFKEIADHQGVGLNTALGRMHRATKLISQALIQAGYQEPEAV